MTQRQFLTTAAIASVVGLLALTAVGLVQYQQDRTRFTQSSVFVTTDTVTNFPWSLLNEEKK